MLRKRRGSNSREMESYEKPVASFSKSEVLNYANYIFLLTQKVPNETIFEKGLFYSVLLSLIKRAGLVERMGYVFSVYLDRFFK